MEKRIHKKSGNEISLLGFGMMRLPRIDPDRADIDEEKARALIDRAIARGVNYFDTAYMYHEGKSEEFAGRVLSEYPKDRYFIATKMPSWLAENKKDRDRIFEEQLKRLRVDRFDYYFLHNTLDSHAHYYDRLDVFRFLDDKRSEGLIRNLGFSHHGSPEYLETVCDCLDWDFAQIQLNYIDWELTRGGEMYETLARRGLQTIVMEPVRGGALSDLGPEANEILRAAAPDRSVSSFSFRYLAALPNVLTVLSGMNAAEQLEDNISSFEPFVPLSEKERAAVERAKAIFLKKELIPCTACRYCMDCAFGVKIPEILSFYNSYLLGRNKIIFGRNYHALGEDALADRCTACGVCMEKCPQGIEIARHMKEIAEIMA